MESIMRSLLIGCFCIGLVVVSGAPALAGDDVQAIVDKAIRAQGGEAKLKSFKAFQSKSKGTLDIMGMKISFSQEAVAAFSGKLKNVMEMDVSGMKARIISVFDGTKGWLAGSV